MTRVLSAPACKGYPSWAPPMPASAVGQQGWHVLQDDWPLPSATLKRAALAHNLGWMQQLVNRAGVDLAPHGKTTLSPELFQMQLAQGAWGLTFASVAQLAFGVAAGVQRAIIANQVLLAHDLTWLAKLRQAHTALQAPFLIDSIEQLAAIESHWARIPPENQRTVPPFDVLIELGLPSGRTGCRTLEQALVLAHAAHASPAVRLVGVECYEGLWAKGDHAADATLVNGLLQTVHALTHACDAAGLFADTPEVLVTSGGSAVYDLVADRLKPTLSKPVRGLLRSGCYITHDDGFYKRLGHLACERLTQTVPAHEWPDCGSGLRAALEVWCVVQSRPEPHLAILNAGKRDLSFDMGAPVPVRWCPAGLRTPEAAPPEWRVVQLNDQHAYLDTGSSGAASPQLVPGDRVALGISHPCTTFDKWTWMPLVSDTGDVTGAITTGF